jgi:pyrroline-5-carboxylate reductase
MGFPQDTWVLGFVGAGVMAETMLAGVLHEDRFTADRVVASDPNSARRAHIRSKYGIQIFEANHQVTERADLVVLAVKPQHLARVLVDLKGRLGPETQVLSIVAGASLKALRGGLDHRLVARAMPNLPCRIHRGMTVWTGADYPHAERIEQVLTGCGQAMYVDDESNVDRATAVNGTGPAIVAQFIKSLTEAATYIGQPRELARETVLATLLGTAEMIRRNDDHVAQLIDEVTSPGGTTSRALQVLRQGRFGAVVTESVDAAYQRTLELGSAFEKKLEESS